MLLLRNSIGRSQTSLVMTSTSFGVVVAYAAVVHEASGSILGWTEWSANSCCGIQVVQVLCIICMCKKDTSVVCFGSSSQQS